MSRSQHSYRVYYEDVDVLGIVYHSRYLNFLERARSDTLLALDLGVVSIKKNYDASFVVRRTEVEFYAPAKLQDLLVVDSEFTKLKRASFEVAQHIYREGDLQKPLVSAKFLIACIDAKGKPSAFPSEVATCLRDQMTHH